MLEISKQPVPSFSRVFNELGNFQYIFKSLPLESFKRRGVHLQEPLHSGPHLFQPSEGEVPASKEATDLAQALVCVVQCQRLRLGNASHKICSFSRKRHIVQDEFLSKLLQRRVL